MPRRGGGRELCHSPKYFGQPYSLSPPPPAGRSPLAEGAKGDCRGGFHIRPEGLPLPQASAGDQWSPLQNESHPAHSCRMSCGWVGEVRTHECGSQSPVPYHLATTHYKKKRPCRNAPVRSLVGCLERFELSASRATIWRANQLRHRHHRMRPKGLEPPAHCLEGSCSIQLSYGRLLRVHVREGHTA